MSFLVVFEGTGKKDSNTKGMRTMTDYANEEEYEASRKRFPNNDRVLAKGISDEEASELVRQTSIESHVMCAIESSIDGNGHINPAVLAMKMETMLYMLRSEGREVDIAKIIRGRERE